MIKIDRTAKVPPNLPHAWGEMIKCLTPYSIFAHTFKFLSILIV